MGMANSNKEATVNYNHIWVIEINFKRKNSPWRPYAMRYFGTRKAAARCAFELGLHDKDWIIIRVSKYMGAIKSGLIKEV
jgi:hypothetical protein